MKPIISMTTIPSRLPHIEPTVRSLERQGLDVYVWIQTRGLFGGPVFDGRIPDFLDGCNVEVVEPNGPIMKLLPALVIADVIIVADDDIAVGAGWASALLAWANRIPSAAVGYRGRQLRGRHYNDSALVQDPTEPTVVDILTNGFGGLFRAEWFGRSIYEEWEAWPLGDNLVIDAHLKRKGIRRFVVPWPSEIKVLPHHEIDELWKINKHRNDEGLGAVGWWGD